MLGYITGLILTCLMLLALPNEAYQGNPMLIAVLIMTFSSVYLLFITKKGKELIQKRFANPFVIALILIVLINIFYICAKGSFSIAFFGRSILAFIIPTMLVNIKQTRESKFHFLDIVSFLLVYLIVLLKLLHLPLIQSDLVTFNGGFSMAVLYLLFIFIGYRRIDMGLDLQLTTKMLLYTLLFAAILIPIDIFVGLKLHFITFTGWNSTLKSAGILTVFMVLFATMTEEIFFRGLIYNYLAQYLGKYSYFVPLIISSLIFGATHLDKFGIAMFFLSTIAGFFYGLTYIKTKSLFCAVSIHTLTNLCWLLFFVTNR